MKKTTKTKNELGIFEQYKKENKLCNKYFEKGIKQGRKLQREEDLNKDIKKVIDHNELLRLGREQGRLEALKEVKEIIDKWNENLDWEEQEGLTREEIKECGRFVCSITDKCMEDLLKELVKLENK